MLFSAYYTSFCKPWPCLRFVLLCVLHFQTKKYCFLHGLNGGTISPLIIITPNESMSFSAYYNNSTRSGRSRRFLVTVDSGERNLSLEERGKRPGSRSWRSPETRASRWSGAGCRERRSGAVKGTDEVPLPDNCSEILFCKTTMKRLCSEMLQ